MRIIECISLTMLLGICIIATHSDIKEGLIRNKVLVKFALIAVILDSIYYGFMVRDLFFLYTENISVLAGIALALFYTHSFAGGDCKLVIVMGLLFPANYYLMYGNSALTLFFVIGFAILYGYIYMLTISIINLIRRKNRITLAYVTGYLKAFGKSFFSALVYISCLNMLFIIISHLVAVNSWLFSIVSLTVTWTVGKLEMLRKWYFVIPVIGVDVALGLALHMLPFSFNPRNYIMVALMLVCQMTIKTNVYEKIEIGELKKGMILSMVSSTLMQNSRIKGLPGISSEDLGSRLTEDEVASIVRWGKSRNVSSVLIVKKIPFAIFLSLGFLSYLVIWVALL